MKEREVNFARVDGVIGQEKRETLFEKRVTVLGLGSLGSEIARLLVMTGIGNFILIDPEKIEPENIVRHVCGLTSLGRYKVASVRDFILKDKNPNAEVFGVVAYAESQPELCSKSDLVILPSWGNIQKEQFIAHELRKRGASVLVAGVYPMGVGGEIFWIKPDSGPCHSCFSNYLKKEIAIKEKPTIYGLDQTELSSVPALAIDINRIATIAADFALHILLGKPVDPALPNTNLIIFANKKLAFRPKLEPLTGEWDCVPQSPDCLMCKKTSSENSVDISNYQNLFENLEKGGEIDGH